MLFLSLMNLQNTGLKNTKILKKAITYFRQAGFMGLTARPVEVQFNLWTKLNLKNSHFLSMRKI